MFERQPLEGYIGCSMLFLEQIFTLRLRLTVTNTWNSGLRRRIYTTRLVRETCELIPGSQFNLIKGVGHIPVSRHQKNMRRYYQLS